MARMSASGVTHALCVSVSLESFPEVLAIAERFSNIYASVGVHPDQRDGREPTSEQLIELGPPSEGRRHWRDRSRLLSGDRGPGVATGTLPDPHPGCAGLLQAVDNPYA